MKKILITGGHGFIGKNIAEQLKNKHHIFSPTKQELNLLNTDDVYNYLKHHCFDTVIHSAQYDAVPKTSTKDMSKTLEYNLQMFFNLVRGDLFYKKLINMGSGAEFGRENWMPLMKESLSNTFIPKDQYGLSKYIVNKFIKSVNSEKYCNMRLFGVFGKYENYTQRFISNACCRALYDIPIKINQNVFFDYLYIDDLTYIIDNFISNNYSIKDINVCTGESIDLLSLAYMILNIENKNYKFNIIQHGLGKEYSGNNTNLITLIPDLKLTPKHIAIEKLYSYYKNIKDQIDINLL